MWNEEKANSMYDWVAPINRRPVTRRVNVEEGIPNQKTRNANEVVKRRHARNTTFQM